MAGLIESIAEHPFAFMGLSVVMLLLMLVFCGMLVTIVRAWSVHQVMENVKGTKRKGDLHDWNRHPTRRVD